MSGLWKQKTTLYREQRHIGGTTLCRLKKMLRKEGRNSNEDENSINRTEHDRCIWYIRGIIRFPRRINGYDI